MQEMLQAFFNAERFDCVIRIMIIGRWTRDLGGARYRNQLATVLRRAGRRDRVGECRRDRFARMRRSQFLVPLLAKGQATTVKSSNGKQSENFMNDHDDRQRGRDISKHGLQPGGQSGRPLG